MLHGPCGRVNSHAKCMQGRKRCDKNFPKPFASQTTIDSDGFPTYRRRDDGKVVMVKGIPLDNRYIVPYNPTLLLLFEGHINVEKCNHSNAIKYLFKYISKGHDRAIAAIYRSDPPTKDVEIDEIKQYYNCRYISSCEGSWRIFGYDIHKRHPAVQRLSFHLPNQQTIVYCSTDDVEELLDKPRVSESQFLSWFETNSQNSLAKSLTYVEFPKHFVYERKKRCWKPRESGKAIGRIHHVPPSCGELYYLRVLLNKVKGPTCFDDLKYFDGVVHNTFRDACAARGLLDDDAEYILAIKEASLWAPGSGLRRFFVSMLLCSCLSDPLHVWLNSKTILSEDLFYTASSIPGYGIFLFNHFILFIFLFYLV